jgi:hypothetical protein
LVAKIEGTISLFVSLVLAPQKEYAVVAEVSSVDFDDPYLRGSPHSSPEKGLGFHEKIFTEGADCITFTRSANLLTTLTEGERKVAGAANIASMGANVSGEVKITVEWGGKDGPSVSGSVSGSVSDDRGNAMEAEVIHK